MKAIYPVTEMIKAYPFMFGLIPEKERNEILKDAQGWSRNQTIKISMTTKGKDFDFSNEKFWQNIIDSLHAKMKRYSISDTPLYGDPISLAVYGFIENMNKKTKDITKDINDIRKNKLQNTSSHQKEKNMFKELKKEIQYATKLYFRPLTFSIQWIKEKKRPKYMP